VKNESANKLENPPPLSFLNVFNIIYSKIGYAYTMRKFDPDRTYMLRKTNQKLTKNEQIKTILSLVGFPLFRIDILPKLNKHTVR